MPTNASFIVVQGAVILVGVAFAVCIIVGRNPRRAAATVLVALAVLGLAGIAATFRGIGSAERARSHAHLINAIPLQDSLDRGFVASSSCQACHPNQYHSWHESFHRTMTQPATPHTVIAPLENVTLENRGRRYHVLRLGDEYWVDMVDPDWEHERASKNLPVNIANPPRTRKRIVMTTGSHHQQTWWVAGNQARKLYNLPFMYLVEDDRIVPREDVFLRPPSAGRGADVWNNNCIECHSVAGEPKFDAELQTFDTAVAELGISCEACHGPGQQHITANQNPAHRFKQHRDALAEADSVVNPLRVDAVASSYICGQCHGLNILKGKENKAGLRYHAGEDLTKVKMILRTDDDRLTEADRADWPRLKQHIDRELVKNPSYLDDRFWPDGMVRVSGREHSAMVESACFSAFELSCLSCHSMHSSSPNDQLAVSMDTNEACLQCHAQFRTSEALTAHTHHKVGSAGSECYNCHMPHTTYGLLKAIRSHHIDSPSAKSSIESGRPNACNLCHLDQTLAFAANHLNQWYGQAAPAMNEDDKTVAAAVLWSLKGDAGQRALIAWHMGWEPAKEASGKDWLAPYLAHLLNDPYAAVRYIAGRSLRKTHGFDDFTYDFVGTPQHLTEAAKSAFTRWMQRRPKHLDRNGPAVLIGDDQLFDSKKFEHLARQRNERTMDLRE